MVLLSATLVGKDLIGDTVDGFGSVGGESWPSTKKLWQTITPCIESERIPTRLVVDVDFVGTTRWLIYLHKGSGSNLEIVVAVGGDSRTIHLSSIATGRPSPHA